MITGRWIFKHFIGWQWGIWHDDEVHPREYGWCWTRATARAKAGIAESTDIESDEK